MLHPLWTVPLSFPSQLCEGTNGSVAIVSHLPIHRCHNVACPLCFILLFPPSSLRPSSTSFRIFLRSSAHHLNDVSSPDDDAFSASTTNTNHSVNRRSIPFSFPPPIPTHIHSPIALKLWCPKATDKSSLSLNRSAVSYFSSV